MAGNHGVGAIRRWLSAAVGLVMAVAGLGLVTAVIAAPAGAETTYTASDCFRSPVEGSDPIFEPTLPKAVDDAYLGTLNTPYVSPVNKGVLANDKARADATEPAGQEPNHEYLKVVVYQEPAVGSLNINADGAFVYTPPSTPIPQTYSVYFSYVALLTKTGMCSAPAVATITLQPGGAQLPTPIAIDDKFLAPDPFANGAFVPLSGDGTLTVDPDGVLKNDQNLSTKDGAGNLVLADVNSPTYVVNHDNLRAQILTQPVWEGTDAPAGTVTPYDGGVEGAVGGFRFTPSDSGSGTGDRTGTGPTVVGNAVFTYKACYIFTNTVLLEPCSKPATVKIPMAPTRTARPLTMTYLGSAAPTVVDSAIVEQAVTWNGTRPIYPRFTQPGVGTLYTSDANPLDGQLPTIGYAIFGPGTLDAKTTGEYWFCDTPTDTPETKCTNRATVTVKPTSAPPEISSITPPTRPDGPFVVTFDQLVSEIDSTDLALVDTTTLFTVPATLTCSFTTPGPSGFTTIMPCRSSGALVSQADKVVIQPTAPLVDGRQYALIANRGSGIKIVSTFERIPLVEIQRIFTMDFVASDTAAPTASPTANALPGVWTKDDVTVNWHWSDHGGSGIDPTKCTTSSTSSGEGSQTLTATCTDLKGNTGTATYAVKVDKTPPSGAPTTSPAASDNGTNNSDVTITWNWSDSGGSGLIPITCSPKTVVTAEGGQFELNTCLDAAGNLGQASSPFIFIDKTAPTASPELSASGWTKDDVLITWHWSDGNGSGLDTAKCPATTLVSSEGVSGASETCPDLAGNVGSAGRIVKIDRTAPTASPTISPAPKGGWNNSDVTITFNWSDGNGSGINSALCPASIVVSSLGAQNYATSCTDLAGNIGGSPTVTVRIDKTGPTAAPTLSPTPNQGWNNGPVTINWNWTDTGGSGIDSTKCTASSITSSGGITSTAAQCTDIAGNSTISAPVTTRIDTAPPRATPTFSAPAGSWSRNDVTVTWNWVDNGGSGIDASRCTTATTSTGEGFVSVTGTCRDVAGNLGSETVRVRVDKTAPALAPAVTPNPVRYGGAATAVANATDAGSGVASSSCAAVGTTVLGARTVTCTATDVAGNTATAPAPYTVTAGVKWTVRPTSIRYRTGSLVFPVVQLTGANGAVIPGSAVANLGTCAVKFQLGNQATACAGYSSALNSFVAFVQTTTNLTVGSTVPLKVTANVGTTQVASDTTSLTVTR